MSFVEEVCNLLIHGDAPTSSPLDAEVQLERDGPESEDVIETSGRGRRKRAPRDIGVLNGCLCGMVVNFGVALNRPAIECQQPGCETRWVSSTVYSQTSKCSSQVLQYHLECIALEQAPAKWICEACEASGPSRAKRPRN